MCDVAAFVWFRVVPYTPGPYALRIGRDLVATSVVTRQGALCLWRSRPPGARVHTVHVVYAVGAGACRVLVSLGRCPTCRRSRCEPMCEPNVCASVHNRPVIHTRRNSRTHVSSKYIIERHTQGLQLHTRARRVGVGKRRAQVDASRATQPNAESLECTRWARCREHGCETQMRDEPMPWRACRCALLDISGPSHIHIHSFWPSWVSLSLPDGFTFTSQRCGGACAPIGRLTDGLQMTPEDA